MSHGNKVESLPIAERKVTGPSSWSRLLHRREMTVAYAIIALCIVIQLFNRQLRDPVQFPGHATADRDLWPDLARRDDRDHHRGHRPLHRRRPGAWWASSKRCLSPARAGRRCSRSAPGSAAAVLIGVYHGVAVSKWAIPSFMITLGSLSIWRGLATGVTRSYPILIDDEHSALVRPGHSPRHPRSADHPRRGGRSSFRIVLNSTRLRAQHLRGGWQHRSRTALRDSRRARSHRRLHTLASFLVGIAGVIVAGRMAQGLPSVAGGYELNAIAAAIIGGTSFFGGVGTVPGVLLGSAFMVVIDNSLILMNVSAYWYTARGRLRHRARRDDRRGEHEAAPPR